MSARFESKVVLVTGGSSGMGEAFAERAAEEGGRVVIAGRRTEAGEAVAARIRDKGHQAHFVRTDVTVESEVSALVEATVEKFGGLHAAFNNAGSLNTFGAVPDISAAGWNLELTQALTSVFFCLKYQIPAMIASGGGAVVNNASNLGVVGMGTVSPYVAAKHGVVGLTKAAALETAAQGIRINALLTGGVDTPLFDATTSHRGGTGHDRRNAPAGPDRHHRRDRRLRGRPAQRRGLLHHRRSPGNRRRFHCPIETKFQYLHRQVEFSQLKPRKYTSRKYTSVTDQLGGRGA